MYKYEEKLFNLYTKQQILSIVKRLVNVLLWKKRKQFFLENPVISVFYLFLTH